MRLRTEFDARAAWDGFLLCEDAALIRAWAESYEIPGS